MKTLLAILLTLTSISSFATGLNAEAICTGLDATSQVVEVNSFVNTDNYCLEDTNSFDKNVVFTLGNKGNPSFMGFVVTAKLNIVNSDVQMTSMDKNGKMTLSYSYSSQKAKLEIQPTNGSVETINLTCQLIQYNVDCSE